MILHVASRHTWDESSRRELLGTSECHCTTPVAVISPSRFAMGNTMSLSEDRSVSKLSSGRDREPELRDTCR